MIIVSAARIATRNKGLTPGNLPQALRFGVAAGLVSLASAIGGAVWLGKLIITGFNHDILSTITSSAFRLTIVHEAPFTIAATALAIGCVLVGVLVWRRQIPRVTCFYLALPAVSLIVLHLARDYAATLVGTPIVMEVQSLLKAQKEGDGEHGRKMAELVLAIDAAPKRTRTGLRLALLQYHYAKKRSMEAFHEAMELIEERPAKDVLDKAAKILREIMPKVGEGMDSQTCMDLYDAHIAALPAGIWPSPFSFALKESLAWMRTTYDSGQRFASQKDNELLHALVDHYHDHEEAPFALFLLGNAEQLERKFADKPAGLLASFTLASQDYHSGLYSEAARERLQRVVNSKSTQSFVDDAALYYGKILASEHRPIDAIAVLENGLGRGNKDREREMVSLMHGAALMLDRTMLDDVLSANASSGTPKLHSDLRFSIAALAAWREVVTGGWSRELIAKTQQYLDVLSTFSVPTDRPASPAAKSLLRATALLRVLVDSLPDEEATRSRQVLAAASRSFPAAIELKKCLEVLGFAGHQLTEEGARLEERMTQYYWAGFLRRQEWPGLAVAASGSAESSSSVSALDVFELEQQILEYERCVGKRNMAFVQLDVERLKSRLQASLDQGSPRDVLISHQLDALSEKLGVEWFDARQEFEVLMSKLQSAALRRRHWARLSDTYLQKARESARQPSMQSYYLERAVEAFAASTGRVSGLSELDKAVIVSEVQAKLLDKGAISLRDVLARALQDNVRSRGVPEAVPATAAPTAAPGDAVYGPPPPPSENPSQGPGG